MVADEGKFSGLFPLVLIAAGIGFFLAGREPGGISPALGALAGAGLAVLIIAVLACLDRIYRRGQTSESASIETLLIEILEQAKAGNSNRSFEATQVRRDLLNEVVRCYARQLDMNHLSKRHHDLLRAVLLDNNLQNTSSEK